MYSKLATYTLTASFAVLGAAVVFALGISAGGSASPDVSQVRANPVMPAAAGGPDVGDPAPAFEAVTLEGDTLRLADYRGRVVVLNFWATWCAPCRVEIPDLVEMQTELGDEAVRFVGVSLDHEGDEVVRAFAEHAGINYPLIRDEGSISEKYGGIYALPTTVVVDAEGVIRFHKPGLVSKDSLMPLLEELAGA